MFTAIWVPFRKVSLILAPVLLSSITNITPVIPVEVQNFWDRNLTRGLASPMQLPQDVRKDLPKNVSCSNQSCFVVAAVIVIIIILLVFFLFFFRFNYQSSRVAPWFRIINYQYRKKVPNLFLSPPQPEDVRQMLNPFPPLTDSSTSVFWKLFGVGIKILILSSEVDLVWKDPDFNPGSLDETVSKRGLHAQSSLRSHQLLFVRRSPLGEWTVPNRWTFGLC